MDVKSTKPPGLAWILFLARKPAPGQDAGFDVVLPPAVPDCARVSVSALGLAFWGMLSKLFCPSLAARTMDSAIGKASGMRVRRNIAAPIMEEAVQNRA